MKLSFSIPSNKSSSSSRPSATKTLQAFNQDDGAGGGSATADSAKSEFVTDFIPSKPLTADAPPKHVIAPIPNSHLLRIHSARKESDDPSHDPSRSHTHFVLHPSAADPAASAIPYGLTLRPNLPSAGAPEGEQPGRRPSSEDLALRRFKEDMASLPDDRGFEEFDDVAIEDFGKSLLAGYGWSEGKGIGRNAKEDTKVVQYNRRAGTEGLGYVPDPAHAAKRKSRRSPPTADEVKQTRELEVRSKDEKRESSREERRSRDSGRDGKRSHHERESPDNGTHQSSREERRSRDSGRDGKRSNHHERESRDNGKHHHRSSSGSQGRKREREREKDQCSGSRAPSR